MRDKPHIRGNYAKTIRGMTCQIVNDPPRQNSALNCHDNILRFLSLANLHIPLPPPHNQHLQAAKDVVIAQVY